MAAGDLDQHAGGADLNRTKGVQQAHGAAVEASGGIDRESLHLRAGHGLVGLVLQPQKRAQFGVPLEARAPDEETLRPARGRERHELAQGQSPRLSHQVDVKVRAVGHGRERTRVFACADAGREAASTLLSMPDTRVPLAASLAGLDEEPVECLRRLAQLGYPVVHLASASPGMRPRDLDGVARRSLRALLRRIELQLGGLDLWIPVGDFLDPGRCDRAVGAVLAAIALAADLAEPGAELRPSVSLVLPRLREDHQSVGPVMETLVVEADRQGIELVDFALPEGDGGPQRLEVQMGSTGGGPVASGQQASEPRDVRPSVSKLHERLRLGLDLPALLATGIGDVTSWLAAHAARLASVRLVDLSRSGMRVPIADAACGALAADRRLEPSTLAASLAVLAPNVVPVADPRQWPDPWAGLRQSLEVWARAVAM